MPVLVYEIKLMNIEQSCVCVKLYVNTGKICGRTEPSHAVVKIKEDQSSFRVLCQLKIRLMKYFKDNTPISILEA